MAAIEVTVMTSSTLIKPTTTGQDYRCQDLLVKELDDFVSSNTRRFFNLTGLSTNFLTKDTKPW